MILTRYKNECLYADFSRKYRNNQSCRDKLDVYILTTVYIDLLLQILKQQCLNFATY